MDTNTMPTVAGLEAEEAAYPAARGRLIVAGDAAGLEALERRRLIRPALLQGARIQALQQEISAQEEARATEQAKLDALRPQVDALYQTALTTAQVALAADETYHRTNNLLNVQEFVVRGCDGRLATLRAKLETLTTPPTEPTGTPIHMGWAAAPSTRGRLTFEDDGEGA